MARQHTRVCELMWIGTILGISLIVFTTAWLQLCAKELAQVSAIDMTDFDFAVWAKTAELDEDVVAALAAEKFNKLGALLMMTLDDIKDFSFEHKGTVRAVQGAVTLLQTQHQRGPLATATVWNAGQDKSPAQSLPQAQAAASNASASGPPGKARDLAVNLDALLGSISGQGRGPGETVTSQRVDLNPEVYLQQEKSGEQIKYHKIVDFIPGAAKVEEVDIGVATLKLKDGTSKVKLDQVSPAQWQVANARIHAHLLKTGELQSENSVDYLAYTCKVGELACRFTWHSVLLYDNEYRQRQVLHGFRWGSDAQHLATITLRERVKAAPPATATGGGQRQASRPQSDAKKVLGPNGNPVCIKFNKSKCEYGAKCNYEHVCLTCLKGHRQSEHDAQTKTD